MRLPILKYTPCGDVCGTPKAEDAALVTCVKDKGHAGPHGNKTGRLAWPNKNEPLEGQGWFCSDRSLTLDRTGE